MDTRRLFYVMAIIGAWWFIMMALLTLSACGDTAGQRAVSGGLIGAGVGAGAGALTTPSHPRYGY